MKRIPVYQRGRFFDWALVSDDDYDELFQYLWKLNPEGYAYRSLEGGGTQRMHRQVMALGPGVPMEVDHRNRKPLDNRRENLRVVTHAQNQQNRSRRGGRNNTSGHRGVTYCKQTGRWAARAVINGEVHWLGRHDTKEQAVEAAVEFRRQHMPYSESDLEIAA